jgi:hypothetical protein
MRTVAWASGSAVPGQLPVVGKKPVLITSDNQVNKLEKTSGLSGRPGNVFLDSPIMKVGRKARPISRLTVRRHGRACARGGEGCTKTSTFR